MSSNELDPEDEDIAQMAVDALNAATRRALESGQTIVVVENDQLVRIGPSGKTVLKKLQSRQDVSVRSKRVSS